MVIRMPLPAEVALLQFYIIERRLKWGRSVTQVTAFLVFVVRATRILIVSVVVMGILVWAGKDAALEYSAQAFATQAVQLLS